MRIKEPVTITYEIEKSKFICILDRCFSVEEAKEKINQLRKKHPNATHIVSAYRIFQTSHSSDDKEPSGTAGVPTLEVLEKNQLTEVIAMTIRYFGGIKLGAGGLARAYTKACALAVKEAKKTTIKTINQYSLLLDYPLLGKIENQLRKEFDIVEIKYQEYPLIIFQCETDPTKKIEEYTAGKYQPVFLQSLEVEVVVND